MANTMRAVTTGNVRHMSAAPLQTIAQAYPHSADVTGLLLHTAQLQIRELEQKLKDMSKLAHEDPLTGLLNRRGFEAVIVRETARAKRHGSPLCLAMLDLDDFKQINDSHGHAAGDMALAHFARVIASSLRQTDSFARLGGEEFVIVLPDTALPSAVDALARLQAALAGKPLQTGEQEIEMSFSAGVSSFASHADSNALLRAADAGMYRAKSLGKNRIVVA